MIDPFSRLAVHRTGGSIIAPRPLGSQRPSVSVIIPCYNYGHFLAECVASALDHEGLDLEVIVVDDASPDGSGEVAEKIAAGDERVHVIRHTTNQRHLATYNDGFAAASGDYLVQLSADDLLPTNSLTRAVTLLEAEPDIGFVYGKTVPFHGASVPTELDAKVEAWVAWDGPEWIAARCRAGTNVIATTEVVWRRSVMGEVGPYRLDLPHSGDLELWMRMATLADVGFVVGPVQALYRLHDANMHVDMFGSGTAAGQLIDLRERWKAFEALFESPARRVGDWTPLRARVRHRLATDAMRSVSYAYARGFTDFPTEDFLAFAREMHPAAERTRAGKAMARRRAIGFLPLPLHPLWAHGAVWTRARSPIMTWRRERIGV